MNPRFTGSLNPRPPPDESGQAGQVERNRRDVPLVRGEIRKKPSFEEKTQFQGK